MHIHLRLRRGEDDDLLAFFVQVGKRQRALLLKQALRTGNWNIVIANEPADEDEFARASRRRSAELGERRNLGNLAEQGANTAEFGGIRSVLTEPRGICRSSVSTKPVGFWRKSESGYNRMKKLNPRSNPNMLIARHLLKANLDTVLESMRDWQATENLDLMFVARVPFAVVWDCDNCIITFRTLSAQTTELSLVLIRPDYLYHAEDSDDGLGILILDQVGLCPSEEAFATWSYLLNQFKALEWLDSAKLSSVYRRYGAWDSMAEELEAFNQSLEPLKRYQEYYETQYAVIEEAEEEALLTKDSPRTPPQPVETEAAAVHLMFETYATGQHSDQAIADLLYAHGYLTRRGKRFTAATVADILRNPFYIGKAVYQRRHGKYNEIYEGTHEPLISQELWDRCQEVRAQRHSASRAVQKPFRIYLLGNLAHCSVCGRRLGGQPTRSGLYYREVSRTRGYDDCPHHSHSIRVEIADRQISAIVMAIRLPPDWQDALNAKVGEDEQLIYLRRQRAELERQRRRLKDMYLHGDFNEDAEMYRAELARIRAALEELPTYDQLENLRQAAATAQTLPELWPQASPEDQRDLLRLMLREVRVDVITGRVVSLRPQPVFIPIFREIALLDEREFGVFVPNWGEHPDADQILAIPHLPTLEAAPATMEAAPFWATLPIAGDENARIAPGLAEALRIGERTATTVTQVCLEGQVPLPDDLRKWEGARAHRITLPEWRALEASSTDVLVLWLGLWHHILHPEFDLDLERLVSEASRVLRAGGVWYWVEVLPLEMPAHWVFRFFPAAWEWVRRHSWTLHALNLKLLEAGLMTRMKNHVSYQPIQASAALAIAERREGLLAHLSDEAYATGLARLKQVIADRGERYVLGSEVQYVEVWAQKQ